MSQRTTGATNARTTPDTAVPAFAAMKRDGVTPRASISKTVDEAAVAGAASQGESLLATRRQRRRRLKRQAPFKTPSETASCLISSFDGDEGNGEDTKNSTGLPTSSVGTGEGQGNFEALQDAEEKNGGEYVMTVISNCLQVVLTMSCDIQIVSKQLFGSCSIDDDAAGGNGPSIHVGDPDTRVVEVDSYRQGLEAFLAFVDKGDTNVVGQLTAGGTSELTDTMQGLESNERLVSERTSHRGSCSTITRQKTGNSLEKSVTLNEYGDTMMAKQDSNRLCQDVAGVNNTNKDLAMENDKQQNNTGRQRDVLPASRSQEHAMILNNVAAEEHVSKLKGSCRMMLRCIKSLVQMLKLAVDANTVAQRAVKWVTTRGHDLAEGITTIVSDTADVTLKSTSKALSEAENAVFIYKELVKGVTDVERSLCNNQVTRHGYDFGDSAAAAAAAAAVDDVGNLVQQASNICLGHTDQDRAVESTIIQPRAQSEVRDALPFSKEVDRSSDEIPIEASKALLQATESSLCAVDAALTVLEILSVSELHLRAQIEKP